MLACEEIAYFKMTFNFISAMAIGDSPAKKLKLCQIYDTESIPDDKSFPLEHKKCVSKTHAGRTHVGRSRACMTHSCRTYAGRTHACKTYAAGRTHTGMPCRKDAPACLVRW